MFDTFQILRRAIVNASEDQQKNWTFIDDKANKGRGLPEVADDVMTVLYGGTPASVNLQCVNREATFELSCMKDGTITTNFRSGSVVDANLSTSELPHNRRSWLWVRICTPPLKTEGILHRRKMQEVCPLGADQQRV